MTLFERIKQLCSEKNISFYRLEKECGFGSQLIEKWKNSSPKVDSLIKVADFFDVSLDWLCGRDKYLKTQPPA